MQPCLRLRNGYVSVAMLTCKTGVTVHNQEEFKAWDRKRNRSEGRIARVLYPTAPRIDAPSKLTLRRTGISGPPAAEAD